MGICWTSPVDTRGSPTKPPAADQSKKKRSNDKRAENPAPRAVQSGQIITPNLKQFTYAELKTATRNFRPDTVVGEGGFGRVFKGWVDEVTYAPSKPGVGMPVAVKKSSPDSAQGLKEWEREKEFLGKFSHPNLVKLLGYCSEDNQYLLVYEYMQQGSLENHLFRKGSAEVIPWEMRLKIAIEAAQGLAFLHTTENTVIYRDFKASNILLDRDFSAKLSDFGLAKLGPANGNSHVSTAIVGTYGYAAPEYIATGHLYVRSDVYGFGVVLLEMLTGLRVLDLNRPHGEHNLVEWAKPQLRDKRMLKKLMDPRLENRYASKAAFDAAQLILKCLESDPKNRPSMEEVLHALQLINDIKMTSKESKAASARNSTAPQQHLPPNHQQHAAHNRPPLHKNYEGGNGARASGRPRSPLPPKPR